MANKPKYTIDDFKDRWSSPAFEVVKTPKKAVKKPAKKKGKKNA